MRLFAQIVLVMGRLVQYAVVHILYQKGDNMILIRLIITLMVFGGICSDSYASHKKGRVMDYIKSFKDIRIEDVPLVGGKNASLGQMISALTQEGILVPSGFAIIADAYWYFIDHNKLRTQIQ